MQNLTDEQLLERYRADSDPESTAAHLNELFRRHHGRVAAWCLRYTRDIDAASDLAQEVFLKAFQQIGSFRGDSKFTTWLYSIARYRCLDEMRQRKTRPEVSGTALDEIEDLGITEMLSHSESRDPAELMRQLIRDSLDETEASAMTLHYVHELPIDLVTRLLGLTNTSGAKAYIVSARRKLKRCVARLKSGVPEEHRHAS
jgi:RNA polymerase sigma-70 factor, ECF subfamily